MYNNTDRAGNTAESISGSTDSGTGETTDVACKKQATTDDSTDADLSPSTFGIDGIDDREDAAEADLHERVDELWGWSP